jgi:hypothetical protein
MQAASHRCTHHRLCILILLPRRLQINFLTSIGLKQDEICNMASISVVLLGLNPETRLKTVTDYLKSRGVSDGSVADLVLRHPRIFEYKVGVWDFRGPRCVWLFAAAVGWGPC